MMTLHAWVRVLTAMAMTCLLHAAAAQAQSSATQLKPLMCVPEAIAYQSDFSKSGSIDRAEWQPRQGTRWIIEDGVLRGQPSTPEYQASKKDHKGLEPRVSTSKTPTTFIAEFSVRFQEGQETAVAPFVEFGHHNLRLWFSKSGVALLADHETVKLAETREVRYEPGRWYHLLAEMNDEEFVVQFADGPTLYAQRPKHADAEATDLSSLGVAGPRNGRVELDSVTLWSVRAETQPDWSSTRATLPKSEPQPFASRPGRS